MNDLLQVAVYAHGGLEQWNLDNSEGECGRTFIGGRPLGSWLETVLNPLRF
jgi:hypothetical protein